MSQLRIELKEAHKEQMPVLERLIQLYLYDFSEMERFDVNREGLFELKSASLESYWSEPERFPFLIFGDDTIAGFVMVNSYTCLDENEGAKSIAEFFIMRKYRRQGVGTRAASAIFDRFPGKWEVRQIKANVAAHRFWRKVIGEYTDENFTERVLDSTAWRGPVQSFDTSKRAASHKRMGPPH